MSRPIGNRTGQQGRTSCWVLGGLGCLGLLILAFVGLYLLGRALQQSFSGTFQQAQQMETKVEPRLKSLYQAIQRYASDHNGKYPPNLQALTPKYIAPEALQPIPIDEKKPKSKFSTSRPSPPIRRMSSSWSISRLSSSESKCSASRSRPISRCRFRRMGASCNFRRVSARRVSAVCVSVSAPPHRKLRCASESASCAGWDYGAC
jgi:hypothetical protein